MNIKIDKKTIIQLFLLAASVILFAWIVFNFETFSTWATSISKVFFPLVLGFCIAFVINIPMRFFEKFIFPNAIKPSAKRARRAISIMLSLLMVVAILAAVLILVVPEFLNALELLFHSIVITVPQVTQWLLTNVELNAELEQIISTLEIDWAQTGRDLLSSITSGATSILDGAVSIVFSISAGIANFFIALVFALYILLSKEKLKHQFATLFKAIFSDKVCSAIFFVGSMTKTSFVKFITGQCTEAVITGLLSYGGMLLFGFPYAPMISALVGVFALIPLVGAIAGSIIGAFMILLVDPVLAIWFIVYSIALQQFEGNIIYPRVVGESVGLPGIWVLAAITVSGGLFGFMGMLACVPVCSVLYALTRLIAQQGVEKKAAAKKLGTEDNYEKTFIRSAIEAVITHKENEQEASNKKSADAENNTDGTK